MKKLLLIVLAAVTMVGTANANKLTIHNNGLFPLYAYTSANGDGTAHVVKGGYNRWQNISAPISHVILYGEVVVIESSNDISYALKPGVIGYSKDEHKVPPNSHSIVTYSGTVFNPQRYFETYPWDNDFTLPPL